MTVAYTLHKTLDELGHMSIHELTDWLAYISIQLKRNSKSHKKDLQILDRVKAAKRGKQNGN